MNDDITEKLDAFFGRFALRTYAKGELLVFGDGAVPPVTYLVDGRVGQYDISDTGGKIMLTIYKPGAFFPMSSAVNNKPNKYFFEALETVQVRQAPPEEAVAFLRREPEVLYDLLRRLYSGMDGLLGRMSLLMGGSAHSRLLYELSVAAERFGTRQPDGSYRVDITEGQLANQSGLARETVSRELQKIAAKGIVELAKGHLFVRF